LLSQQTIRSRIIDQNGGQNLQSAYSTAPQQPPEAEIPPDGSPGPDRDPSEILAELPVKE